MSEHLWSQAETSGQDVPALNYAGLQGREVGVADDFSVMITERFDEER